VIMVFTFSSCSLSPFSPTSSGRSYGKGHFYAAAGNVNSSYHMKFGMGVTEDFDAGFVMEFGEIATSAIYLKYSFINNEVGPSVNGEFGYGSTETTKHFYIGSAASLAFSKEFEIFFNGRINSVSTDETDIEKDEYQGNIKILEYQITYLQLSYGFNIWFSESSGLSLYSVHFQGEDIETSKDSIFGGSFLFNF